MRVRGAVVAPLFVLGAAWIMRHWLDVVEVRGRSMLPTLVPGDRLLLVRLAGGPRPRDVVVAPDPRAPSREIVKRVRRVSDTGVDLRGDNPTSSTDGGAFGDVPSASIRWRVVGRYWPPERIGPIPAAPEPYALGGEAACALPEALVGGEG